MVEFFANSLSAGFFLSSGMGKSIVLLQLGMSFAMWVVIIGKLRELRDVAQVTKRVDYDFKHSARVLDYYLLRKDSSNTPLEKIYAKICERVLGLMPMAARQQVIARTPDCAVTLTKYQIGLVDTVAESVLDAESLRLAWGMGIVKTIVALGPMLGLLGTVWGVLDAFADMGAAGSATIATMAPAISSALVTTVVGLLVAIAGAAAHTVLLGSLRKVSALIEGVVSECVERIHLEYQGTGGAA